MTTPTKNLNDNEFQAAFNDCGKVKRELGVFNRALTNVSETQIWKACKKLKVSKGTYFMLIAFRDEAIGNAMCGF